MIVLWFVHVNSGSNSNPKNCMCGKNSTDLFDIGNFDVPIWLIISGDLLKIISFIFLIFIDNVLFINHSDKSLSIIFAPFNAWLSDSSDNKEVQSSAYSIWVSHGSTFVILFQ